MCKRPAGSRATASSAPATRHRLRRRRQALGVNIRTGVRATGITLRRQADQRCAYRSATLLRSRRHRCRSRFVHCGPSGRRRRTRGPDQPPVRGHRAVSTRLSTPDTTPTVRDPEHNLYLRAAGGGLIPAATRPRPDRLAAERFAAPVRPPRAGHPRDYDDVVGRGPSGPGLPPVAKVICGPEGFTPDGEPVAGATEVPGLWVAAGMGLHGMALAPGSARRSPNSSPPAPPSGMSPRSARCGSARSATTATGLLPGPSTPFAAPSPDAPLPTPRLGAAPPSAFALFLVPPPVAALPASSRVCPSLAPSPARACPSSAPPPRGPARPSRPPHPLAGPAAAGRAECDAGRARRPLSGRRFRSGAGHGGRSRRANTPRVATSGGTRRARRTRPGRAATRPG